MIRSQNKRCSYHPKYAIKIFFLKNNIKQYGKKNKPVNQATVGRPHLSDASGIAGPDFRESPRQKEAEKKDGIFYGKNSFLCLNNYSRKKRKNNVINFFLNFPIQTSLSKSPSSASYSLNCSELPSSSPGSEPTSSPDREASSSNSSLLKVKKKII